jgi:hypothetical protein
VNEEALAHWGLLRKNEKKNVTCYLAAYSVTPSVHNIVTWLVGQLKSRSLIDSLDINSLADYFIRQLKLRSIEKFRTLCVISLFALEGILLPR